MKCLIVVKKLEYLDLNNFNTENLKYMYSLLFNRCYNLKSINGFEKFDTNNAINIQYMF